MTFLVLIGTIIMIIWEMLYGKISLNLVLLLLLVNFVNGSMLKFMYISLIVNIRPSPFHLHVCQLLVLLPQLIKISSFVCRNRVNMFIYLLEFLSSEKPQVSGYSLSSTMCLYFTPKGVKLYTILLYLNSILSRNSQWGSLSAPSYPQAVGTIH